MSDMAHPTHEHARLDFPLPGAAHDSVPARLSRALDPEIRPIPGARAGADGHITDHLRIIYKRRWTALTAFIVAAGSMAIYSSAAVPLYTARAELLIENENPNVVKFAEVYEPNKNSNDYYQTQYRILQSRLIARRTIESQKLWNHPLLGGGEPGSTPSTPPTVSAATAALFQPILSWWPNRPAPESKSDPSETAAQAPVVDAFLSSVEVIPVRNSRLVDVTFTSPDAQFAARAVNALAKQYIDQNLEFRFLATKEATDFLNAQTAEQRKTLEESEQALQAYREKTGAMAIEDRQNIVVQRLADLNTAVTRARTDRIEKESVNNQIAKIQNDSAALDTFPAILNNTFIQQLKSQLNELQRQRAQLEEKLGARHPDMTKVQSALDATEARLNTEVQKVVHAIRNDYQAALANERALQASLDQQRAQAQEINRASAQYGVLERDAAANQTMFAGLLQRSRETGISGELRTSNIRIVDAAEVPRSPSSPDIRRNTKIGILGGLLFGVSLAFFFEYLDSRIKDPDEVKDVLGLSFLGMVPAFKPKDVSGPPLVGGGLPSDFNEAFRSIRTNLFFASTTPGPKTLLITSTGPGEGKSVVSANIATSLAQSSMRVLLIDGDMRRPKLHEFFGASSEPGLSNVLVGNAKASEAVRRTLTRNLWLLPCGKLPPNPAELLGSARFQEFIRSLCEHFDWIVIDSPPVMAVTDPGLLAHIANGVVFVIGSEMTNRWTAATALEKLDAGKPNYLGAVLNKVNVRGNPYFYSKHYRKEYQKYYTKKAGA
jgi:capsular exopolysaccharide synthesis family protein